MDVINVWSLMKPQHVQNILKKRVWSFFCLFVCLFVCFVLFFVAFRFWRGNQFITFNIKWIKVRGCIDSSGFDLET